MAFTSRVKIEYSDPSNIFPTFASGLLPKLPLRELHWSSSSRPIRSIRSLHVELVSDDEPKISTEPISNESLRKERRHQIPGLRQTPYLKIYLLHCNDVESYRESSRKQLRDWIKGHKASAQSGTLLNKQDNHDAFEWLIINVVSSTTDLTTNTSGPVSNKGEGNVERGPSSSLWPSRNSISVIDKIRSGFNGTSKNNIDRVVQVQLAERPLEGAPQHDKGTRGTKNGWDDLIFKLKSLILASFDLRVRQYEEDIREREGQKQVFGWNFNTFFVLKEGLAMGFENMGLIEDALTVYRELSFGLNTVVEEEHIEGTKQQTAHFMSYTEDLYENFKQGLLLIKESAVEGSQKDRMVADPGISLLDTERKPYRELILSNKITVFDFQCYVFARQVTLSLRLANVSNKQTLSKPTTISRKRPSGGDRDLNDDSDSPKPSASEPENLLLLAEIIRSSIDFLTSTARIIRKDVQCAIEMAGAGSDKHEAEDQEVENFVASWLFAAGHCITHATSVQSLTSQTDTLLLQLAEETANPKPYDDGGPAVISLDSTYRKHLPARTSSLPSRNPLMSTSPPKQIATIVSSPGNLQPGSQIFAAERGDLLALIRRVLGELGRRSGSWKGDATHTILGYGSDRDSMEDIKLDTTPTRDAFRPKSSPILAKKSLVIGICNTQLLWALTSWQNFYEEHERITKLALVHYVVGDRSKAAQTLTADLAASRFQLGNYREAAAYFRQLAPSYSQNIWSDLEITMLDMYAECLKHLREDENYVRISLKILAKVVRNSSTVIREPNDHLGEFRTLRSRFGVRANEHFSKILATSKLLKGEISAPMIDYFDRVELSRHIRHFLRQDGFELILKLRSLFLEDFQAESVRVRIVCIEGSHHSELWLDAKSTQSIRPGMTQILLSSMVVQPGCYILDKVYIRSSNITFTLDLSPTAEGPLFSKLGDSTSVSEPSDSAGQRSILVWPRPESLSIQLKHFEAINLEQPSSIKLVLMTGQNCITDCKICLRAASAGLRLHTAEAEVVDGQATIVNRSQAGTIDVRGVFEDMTASIRIPYSTESDLREISVRVTIDYATKVGNYTFMSDANLSTLLPLAVNVQDFFKKGTLVSKFTIGTSSAVPVRISSCHLDGNRDFRVVSSVGIQDELDIFVRQPLSLLSKICRMPQGYNDSLPGGNRLFLKVQYRRLDEDINAAVEKRFLSVLKTSAFWTYSRVLAPALLARLRIKVAAQDLESIYVLQEINLGDYEEWEWDGLITRLPREHGEGLEKWLRSWHEKNQTVLFERGDPLLPVQHLAVPVEIPQVQVLHTAYLRRLSSLYPKPDAVPIGEGIPVELTISHTREWMSTSITETTNYALDFCFEVHANPDMWIVGGQRKCHFSALEGETSSFALLLWPQRTGYLLLPSVEIQSLTPRPDRSEDQDLGTVPAMSCEVDYQNLGEAILVVPNLLSTTVSLDPNGTGGGWLVDSTRRQP